MVLSIFIYEYDLLVVHYYTMQVYVHEEARKLCLINISHFEIQSSVVMIYSPSDQFEKIGFIHI